MRTMMMRPFAPQLVVATVIALAAATSTTASAFVIAPSVTLTPRALRSQRNAQFPRVTALAAADAEDIGSNVSRSNDDDETKAKLTQISRSHVENTAGSGASGLAVIGALSTWLAFPLASLADSPDWGLFEGRTGSLLHPVFMGGLFLVSVSTALLGFQWRRQRTIGDDMAALKKNLATLLPAGAASVQAAMGDDAEAQDASKYTEARAIEAQIADLQAERKELSQKNPRDQHFWQGALMAFLGTCFAIEVRLQEMVYGFMREMFRIASKSSLSLSFS
jgi:Protein of unknown function (DUF4079)